MAPLLPCQLMCPRDRGASDWGWKPPVRRRAGSETPVLSVRPIELVACLVRYLHANAQTDILKNLEESGKSAPVVFSTHSPYLLEADKLERVRLVQKLDDAGTVIHNKIHQVADKETLTPILTAIGLSVRCREHPAVGPCLRSRQDDEGCSQHRRHGREAGKALVRVDADDAGGDEQQAQRREQSG